MLMKKLACCYSLKAKLKHTIVVTPTWQLLNAQEGQRKCSRIEQSGYSTFLLNIHGYFLTRKVVSCGIGISNEHLNIIQ